LPIDVEAAVSTLQAPAPDTETGDGRKLSWPRRVLLRALMLAVIGGGVALLAYALLDAAEHPEAFPWVFIAGAFVLGALRLDAYGSSASLSPVAVIAAGALGGPSAAALAGFCTAGGIAAQKRKVPDFRELFNGGEMTLAGAASGMPFIFFSISNQPDWLWMPLLGCMASVTLYISNMLLFCPVLGLMNNTSPLIIWRERFRWAFPQTTMLGLIGTGLAAAYREVGIYELAAFALPVAGMYISWRQYLARTRNSVEELRAKNTELDELARQLRLANQKLAASYRGTLEALIRALDARDDETEGHSYRVSAYSQIIAEQMGVPRGTPEWETIARGALLHDIGKIGVRDAVLLKPAMLTEAEWKEMRSHTEIGYALLSEVDFLRPAAELVWSHHERYDGSGYPRQLKGDEIPLGARIFAVADAFDAMTSNRPYRKAMAIDVAVKEIQRCAGSQFDPKVVAAFEVVWPKLVAVRERAREMVA